MAKYNEERTEYTGFACSCGAEGKARMAALHERVNELFFKGKVEQRHYLTSMLYALAGFEAWIEGVPLDPGGWGAIRVEGGSKADPLNAYVQFDIFEDGIAEILLAYHDKYGPYLERPDDEDDEEEKA